MKLQLITFVSDTCSLKESNELINKFLQGFSPSDIKFINQSVLNTNILVTSLWYEIANERAESEKPTVIRQL